MADIPKTQAALLTDFASGTRITAQYLRNFVVSTILPDVTAGVIDRYHALYPLMVDVGFFNFVADQSLYAIYDNGPSNTFTVDLASIDGWAGNFQDSSFTVIICNNTFALDVTGPSRLHGNVVCGLNASSLIGFYGATPVDQPAAIADAAITLADCIAQLNKLLAAIRELGLIAT